MLVPDAAPSIPTTVDGTTIRLRASSGAILEARRVAYGERYGPDGNRRHATYEPRIEFVGVGRLRRRHLATYDHADDVARVVRTGFAPGDVRGFDLPRGEAERLRVWLRDPFAADADATVALLVGLDASLDRAAVALARLRLDSLREADARRALAELAREPVTLVVVGEEVRGAAPLAFVRSLRRRPATAALPVLVVGGNARAAAAAGADAHVPVPLQGTQLVAAAAGILHLV